MSEIKSETEEKPPERPMIVRNATDLQRLKLEKLMKNPEKAIIIPEKPKERGMPAVPEFVRNVMGSSAGAGSGEFHVYRHLRRKEYARQKYMKEKGERERLEFEYHQKLEDNKQKAEEKTAKKRKKRLKRKEKMKNKKKMPKLSQKSSDNETASSESEEEMENENEKSKEEKDSELSANETCAEESVPVIEGTETLKDNKENEMHCGEEDDKNC